ncbi:hypothetical protein PWG15_10225 [Ensifer adhaerens]|uniref:hypothetical protein n=1 Tax=Ensifer adhaerens TaxID=106592 RepID=UPI0023A9FFA6|nr:hypothetical protein [Ensifer adhaerens]WDZ78832.1 hypothetical protein PWG15_10225 [Ensifer adhaerens]
MKTILAAAASFAFATSAFAAMPQAGSAVPQPGFAAPTEKMTVLKTEQMIELAWGPGRNLGVSTNRNGGPTKGKTYTG